MGYHLATFRPVIIILNKRGNWDEAEELYQRSLKLRAELGDRSEIAII